MHNSKLFTLLRGIDPSEIRWLHKFLKSPFYNSNQTLLQLFEYIKKYYPDLESPKLTKEFAFKKLFPKEKYQVQRMRKLMHELAVLTEDFLVAQQLKKDGFEKKKILNKALGERNIYDLFVKGIEERKEELEESPYRNASFFLAQFQLKEQFFGHPTTIRQRDSEHHIQFLSEQLDHFYFLKKLEIGCSWESVKKIYSIKDSLPFIEEVIQEIQNRKSKDIFTIKIYHLVYQLFTNENNEKTFQKLHQLFLENRPKLEFRDRETVLKCLVNYGIFQINRGKKNYNLICLNLFKIGLKDNLLLENNFLPESTFANIIFCATFEKEIDWAIKIISQYSSFLNPEDRNEVVLISTAKLHFHKNQFEQVIELLREVIFEKTLYKMTAKMLLLRCYFEMLIKDESYYDLVLSQLESFDRYIRREQKISELAKENFQNFGKWLKKLVYFYWNKKDLSEFEFEISKKDKIANKIWLIEKSKKIKEGKTPSFIS